MVTTKTYSVARTHFSSRIGLALIGGAALLLTAGAQAHDANQKSVRYEDLNLAQSADARVLYGRLRTAANQVCGQYDSKDLRQRSLQRTCVAGALHKAVQDVNDDALTALHQSHPTMRIAQNAAAKTRG